MPFDPNAHVKSKQGKADRSGSPILFAAEDALIEKHISIIISHPREAVSLAYSLGSLIKQRNWRADARILELEQRLCDERG